MTPRHGYPYPGVQTFADVPPPGPFNLNAREGEQFDFKKTASPKDRAEQAKDMAAFANVFGGVILIGADLRAGVVTHPGISHAHAHQLADAYEQAAKDLCVPVPRVAAISIPLPSAPATLTILAINIDPSVHLVGASEQKTIDTPWRFPARSHPPGNDS